MWVYLLLALLAGSMLPVQAGVNAQLARGTKHVVLASLISFGVGTLTLLAATAALRPALPAPGALLAQTPWWGWLGGLLGAFFIAASTIVAPKLGAALFVAVVVAGQVLTALTVDHFGWFGFAVRPLTLWRVLGAALLLAGIWLIKEY